MDCSTESTGARTWSAPSDMGKITRGESCRVALSERNGRLSPTNHHSSRPTFHNTNVYMNSVLATDRNVFGEKSLKIANKHKVASYKDFGLQGWREYAALKFADHEKFTRSPHGKNIIVAEALREYQREMRGLLDWADEVETCAADLESALRDERERRVNAETRILQLEAELKRRGSPSPQRRGTTIMNPGGALTIIAEATETDTAEAVHIAQRMSPSSRTSGGLVKTTSPSSLSPWMTKRLHDVASSSRAAAAERRATSPSGTLSGQPLEAIEEQLAAATPLRGNRGDGSGSGSSSGSGSGGGGGGGGSPVTPGTEGSGGTPAKRRQSTIMSKVAGMFGRVNPTPSPVSMSGARPTTPTSETNSVTAPHAQHAPSVPGTPGADEDLDALEEKINAALRFGSTNTN